MTSKIFRKYSLFLHVNEPDDELNCSIRRHISILKKKKSILMERILPKFNLKKSSCTKQIISHAIFLTSFKCTFVNYTLPGTIKIIY